VTSLLLDTHAFIWYSENDPKLPNRLKTEIEKADQVYISIASLWEIAIKLSIKKLSLLSSYESIEDSLEPAGISLLPISFADTVQVMNLPLHHRDPFDRIIIAQAINRSIIVVSGDSVFKAYPIQVLWE
jgi:PIN domain nuclease of toxin-antitoxin system